MKDERLMEAFEAWDELSAIPEMRMAYTSRLKNILDTESKLRYAMTKGKEEGRAEGIKEGKEQGRKEGRAEGIKEGKEQGRKEGRAEGIKEGIEQGAIETNKNIIFNGYRNGLDVATLSMLTGYSEQDVQAVIQSFQKEYNKND